MQGWIKIHRQLLEWEWYDDNNTFRLFIHLMLKANHKEKNYRGTVVKVGSLLTGLDVLSKETGLSVQQVRTCIKRLKSTSEITIKTSSKGSVIQLVNYKKYQLSTSETTNEQQTSNKRATTNKNVKNEKNDNNKEAFILFWDKYPVKKSKAVAEKSFSKLSKEDIKLIFATLDSFIKHKPFETYNHPMASTYINQKRWLDEIKINTTEAKEDKLLSYVKQNIAKYGNS